MNNGSTKGCEPATFATLRDTPSIQVVFQMHRNLRDDSSNNTSDELIANLDRDCKGDYIKLSVEPSGKQYTVEIPARGMRRTFETRNVNES